MARFALLLSYNGAFFSGWQVQPGRATVQGELETAIGKITGENVRITGASRTDAGVSAIGQVAHLDIKHNFNKYKMLRSINSLTSSDIVVKSIVNVEDTFHARYAALGKRYRYTTEGDVLKLREIADLFTGEHNFAAFAVTRSVPDNPVCTIWRSEWHRAGNGVVIYIIEGDRFLHKMVRMIVGAQLSYGRGRLTRDALERMLRSGERDLRWRVAPAERLLLERIFY